MLSYMRANIRDDIVPFDDIDLSLCTHIHPFVRATGIFYTFNRFIYILISKYTDYLVRFH